MKENLFLINYRFAVDKDNNEVTDQELGQKKHIEPRLTRLLCLFMDHAGGIVTRQYIIHEIWDDYPGANEGLNQAISFLRKLLHDEQKKIIQTVPKKGYIFKGIVAQQRVRQSFQDKRRFATAMGAAAIILMLLLLQPVGFSVVNGRWAIQSTWAKSGVGNEVVNTRTTATAKPRKTRHLKTPKVPVTDDGDLDERKLGELARLDKRAPSGKTPNPNFIGASPSDDGNPDQTNLKELGRLDMLGASGKAHH